MKTKEISCRECKQTFIVNVNKDIKNITILSGLPNCRHHDGVESIECFLKRMSKKDKNETKAN